MDKTTLRIISKIGLIIVMFGFCMPISCNANGFQIAEVGINFSSDGINPFSLALYGIFAFSCVSAISLLLIIMKKDISMGWDWFSMIGVNISTLIVFIRFASEHFDMKMLQSGAYAIMFGLIIAILFFFMTTFRKDNKNGREENKHE